MAEHCSECGAEQKYCLHCGEKIVFVPQSGFGNRGNWQHVHAPKTNIGHQAHPNLHITP